MFVRLYACTLVCLYDRNTSYMFVCLYACMLVCRLGLACMRGTTRNRSLPTLYGRVAIGIYICTNYHISTYFQSHFEMRFNPSNLFKLGGEFSLRLDHNELTKQVCPGDGRCFGSFLIPSPPIVILSHSTASTKCQPLSREIFVLVVHHSWHDSCNFVSTCTIFGWISTYLHNFPINMSICPL